MIKITKYCDICGREQHKNYDNFYQMYLPELDYDGNINLSDTQKDICKDCFRELYWKMLEIKHPNTRSDRIEI